MMLRVLVLCAVAKAAFAATGSTWCVGPALLGEARVAKRAGAEFRGAYRDLTLWIEDEAGSSSSCERFGKVHIEDGNDGLWVVEFDEEALMQTERKRMESIDGIDVMAARGNTIVVGGGEVAADLLGYDACGAEEMKRFISVPTQNILGSHMPKAAKQHYLSQPYNADVELLLNTINQQELVDTISHLENYTTRNSFSGANGLDAAVEWAEERFESLGFETERFLFQSDMTAELIAVIPGSEEPDKIVVVGAHYDSRGTLRNSPTQRAPGADDNGSGSASVLELARIISETGAKFKHTLQLCLFTGEEQGLVGSRALAKRMKDDNQNVIAMFNADMIGYAPEGDGIVLAYMNRYNDPDLTEVSRQITQTYVPEVETSLTNVCCSDQQSFMENGFPSVGFFETPQASVVYPGYHNSNDLLAQLSPEKIFLMTKATLASVIVLAEPL